MTAGTALTAIGVRPRKSRGQNFLVQVAVANRIVDAAHLPPEDRVLEIGLGLGILSERIAAHPLSKLTLVELEPSLASQLEQRFAGDRRVRIVNADFLKADFAALCDKLIDRRLIFVNMSNSAGGFVDALKKPGRTIISATRPNEYNEPRFPQYFVQARKIRSGSASTMNSALSCGYGLPSPTASAMFSSPASEYTRPMNVSLVTDQ